MGDLISGSNIRSSELEDFDLEQEIQRRTRHAERSWRLKIVIAVAPGAALLVLLTIRLAIPFEALNYRRWPYPLSLFVEPQQFLVVATVLALFAIGVLLMLYLQTGFKKENDPASRLLTQFVSIMSPEVEKDQTKDHAFARRLLRIEETLRSLSRRQSGDDLTSSDRRRLLDDLVQKLR